MKKIMRTLLAICIAAAMCLSVAACNPGNGGNGGDPSSAKAAGYLTIDINPSVELTVNDKGVVTSARAANNDAAVLLSGADLIGMTAGEAAKEITRLAEQMGFLNDNNTKVTVLAAAQTPAEENKLKTDAEKGVTEGSGKAVVSDTAASLEREVRKLKEADPELYKDLTPAKLRLIKAAMSFDAKLTMEQAATKTVAELSETVKDRHEQFKDFINDELKEKFEAMEDKIEAEIEKQIAAIYGGEYAEKAELLASLEAKEDEFEKALENAELTSDDVNALVAAFGLENADALKGKDGKITADSVEDYIDDVEDDWDNKGGDDDEIEAMLDAAEEILERYEEAAEILTADMAEELKNLTGADITTLDGLEEFIETLEEELDELKDGITLTEEQKTAIKALEKSLDKIEDEIKELLKAEIQKVKDEYKALKEELLNKGEPAPAV